MLIAACLPCAVRRALEHDRRILTASDSAGVRPPAKPLGGVMRGKGLVLGLAGATVLASLLVAQQKPIRGCNAALSCNQPRGFSTLTGEAGGSVLFGVGVRWGPGINFLVVTPSLSSPTPEPTPNLDARTFRLQGVSLLPPQPTPTPVPKPASRE